jgi:hypothetical protein
MDVRNELECLSLSGLFQASLMFADKARSLPKSGVPERCSTEIGSDHTNIRLGWESLPGQTL